MRKGKEDEIRQVSYYHGGDALYQLKNAPGFWHEQLLEEYIPEGEENILAIDYYEIKPNKKAIVVIGRNGEEYMVTPEFGGVERSVKDMISVAKVRTKNGFDKRGQRSESNCNVKGLKMG